MNWSLSIGRLSGIPVGLHWSFLLYALYRLLIAPDKGFEALWMVALFGTILVHELGHCWAARNLGLSVHSILLWPLGGLAYSSSGRTAEEDLRVTVAGPAMHIPLALLFSAILLATGHPVDLGDLNPLGGFVGQYHYAQQWWFNYCYAIVHLQASLFCFNLLPAYPMDGGRILVAVLSTRMPMYSVARVAMTVSGLVGLLMIVSGFSTWIGIMLILEAGNIYNLMRTGMLEAYPLFYYASGFVRSSSSYPPAKRRPGLTLVGGASQVERPSFLQKSPKLEPEADERVCPHCQHVVPKQAMMCGFCERSL